MWNRKLTGLLLLAGFTSGVCPGVFAGSKEVQSVPQLTLAAEPAYSVLKADEKQSTWMRVGLTGFRMDRKTARAPLNVALVIDRSGSMQGEKIARAREAAIGALDLLQPTDIVSVIAYDSDVSVLVPATRLTDREQVASVIRGIAADGNTALFGGVSKGAAEVRKFLDDRHVNRIILLSDGLANVGPSSPGELGSLGASLKKENISVSTLGLGLGYNEDLMVELAGRSGGNHQFIEDASELASIFRREFNEVLSVVAQEIDLTIDIPAGIRPVRVLGNAADVNGQQVVTRLSQICSEQRKFVVVEVEIAQELTKAASEQADAAEPLTLALIQARYTNLISRRPESVSGKVVVAFSNSDEVVKASLNNEVMADVVALVASEQNKLATELLDRGELFACRQILTKNAEFLRNCAAQYKSPSLEASAKLHELQLKELEDVSSNTAPGAVLSRKRQRDYQLKVDAQGYLAAPEKGP